MLSLKGMDVETSVFNRFIINSVVETGEVELPVHEESVAAWILEGGDRQKYDVQAADLSETGLILTMDRRLPLGIWAKINMRCGIVFGRITRVVPCPNGEFWVFIRVDGLLPRWQHPVDL